MVFIASGCLISRTNERSARVSNIIQTQAQGNKLRNRVAESKGQCDGPPSWICKKKWGPPTTYLTAFNSLVDHLNLESDNIDNLVPWHKHIDLDGSLFGPNKCQGTNTVNRKQRWHIQLSASVIIFCRQCAVWISRRTSFSSMFCWNGRQRQCSCMSDISIHGRTRVLTLIVLLCWTGACPSYWIDSLQQITLHCYGAVRVV